MKKNILIIPVFVVLLSTNLLIAQPSVAGLSLKYGVIQSYNTPNPRGFDFIPYYEIQLDGNLIKPFFSWGFYLSYWDDNVDHQFPIMDYKTYSFNSKNVGVRLYLSAPQFNIAGLPLDFSIFGGVSHSFINSSYIGGTDFSGSTGSDYSAELNNAELGIRLNINIMNMVSLFGEASRFIVLNDINNTFAQDKNAYAFGFVYSMN